MPVPISKTQKIFITNTQGERTDFWYADDLQFVARFDDEMCVEAWSFDNDEWGTEQDGVELTNQVEEELPDELEPDDKPRQKRLVRKFRGSG